MSKKIVYTSEAPAPVGPYSQAVIAGHLVYTAGQIPLSVEGEVVGHDVHTQTRQVLINLEAVLKEAGSSLDKVIKTTVFLKDLNDFAEMNKVYGEFFEDVDNAPARSTVQVVKLPVDALVEIEAVATI